MDTVGDDGEVVLDGTLGDDRSQLFQQFLGSGVGELSEVRDLSSEYGSVEIRQQFWRRLAGCYRLKMKKHEHEHEHEHEHGLHVEHEHEHEHERKPSAAMALAFCHTSN